MKREGSNLILMLIKKKKKIGFFRGHRLKIDHAIVTESFCTLSLEQYMMMTEEVCKSSHVNCTTCQPLIKVCEEVLTEKVIELPTLWRKCFNSSYDCEKAQRRLMAIPLATLRLSEYCESGKVFVIEKGGQSVYSQIVKVLKKSLEKKENDCSFSKEVVSDVLSIAESEPERERIKHVVAKVRNESRRKTKQQTGVDIHKGGGRDEAIKKAVQLQKQVSQVFKEFRNAEIKSFLESNGCVSPHISTESDDEEDEEEFDIGEEVLAAEPILSETESEDDGEEDVGEISNDSLSEEEIKEKVRSIKELWRNKYKKKMTALQIMRRKMSKYTKTFLDRHPEVGTVMEEYAKSCDVGADRWRRTGMITLTGDTNDSKRLTYKKLKEYLEDYYKETISKGTVVQLCAVKNKRILSSKRYKVVANITFRKARKGFNLKKNPDDHYSRSLYRNLDVIQQRTDHFLLGRDDQAGFRLDTTYTHKQYGSLNTTNTITTRTDFVNKNATILQITSYNFPSTKNNHELCAGVVKGSMVHQKNPSQHMADLYMLEEKEEFRSVFGKQGEMIRADGAGDEGPGHHEVQFLWTERHYKKKTKLCLISTRCSGDSFLNRVELQNGHLARGHSNLFIPSTIKGEPYNVNGRWHF